MPPGINHRAFSTPAYAMAWAPLLWLHLNRTLGKALHTPLMGKQCTPTSLVLNQQWLSDSTVKTQGFSRCLEHSMENSLLAHKAGSYSKVHLGESWAQRSSPLTHLDPKPENISPVAHSPHVSPKLAPPLSFVPLPRQTGSPPESLFVLQLVKPVGFL